MSLGGWARLRTVEVHRELCRALPGLAFPAGARDAGLPVSQFRIEAAGDAAGFLDVDPLGFGGDIRGDLARGRDCDVTLLAGGILLDRADLTRA